MGSQGTSEPTFEKIEMEETRKTEKEKDRDRDICIILCIQFASFSLFSCIHSACQLVLHLLFSFYGYLATCSWLSCIFIPVGGVVHFV